MGTDSFTFRRKTPSQMLRDRRRIEDFGQMRENETTTVPEPSIASQTVIEHEPKKKIIESAPSENVNTKADSSPVHTSPDTATDYTERAARTIWIVQTGG